MDDVILIGLLFAGLAAHFLKKVIELRNSEHAITLGAYWREYPYRTVLAVVGALAGFMLLYGTAEMTRATAFGIGYLADSIAGIMGKKTEGKL